ncbi:MAG TPA: DUF4166 domain-containing protein [Kofleriaceae bacterium]|jgi:hypothetical protein|nr:DUF4166 domain-containing protein [Kofleriaceae bacterium]
MRSVYPAAFGDRWAGLSASLQRFFASTRAFVGDFEVRSGNRLARVVRAIMRMPRPGPRVPVQLRVEETTTGETWRRSFRDKKLDSRQRRVGELVVDRFGPTEVWFALEAGTHDVVMRQVRTVIRIGPLRIPWPRVLGPRISGTMRDDGALHVAVRVAAPLIGLVISYEGVVTEQDA